MAFDVGSVGALTRHVVRSSFGKERHVCGSNEGINVQFLVFESQILIDEV
jgi:hypothetical protein